MCSIETIGFLLLIKEKQLKIGVRVAFNLSFCAPSPGPYGLGDYMRLLPPHPHPGGREQYQSTF